MKDKTGKLLGKNTAGVNRILPHKHKFAWDLFIKSCANNWMPTEISMQEDIGQWKSNGITDEEKLLVKRCLGFFAGSESLVGNNLLLSAFRFINDAECRQYILRQAFEESLHNLTIVYICDSLDLDIDEVFNAYETIPSIKAKDSPLEFQSWDMKSALIDGPFATKQSSEAFVIPEIIIVPLLAFDLKGARIGYGGGYYDRTIEALRKNNPNLITIGVAYDGQKVDAVPTEEHDQKLDMVVTEKTTYRVG